MESQTIELNNLMKISLLKNSLLAFVSLTMMTGCDMPAGDFAGALAQAIDDSNRSSSYASGSSYSNYSSPQSYGSPSRSYYPSDTSNQYTGVSSRLSGEDSDSDSDSGSSYADGVKAFEAAQMAKVAALRNRYEGRTGTYESTEETEPSNSSWSQKHANMTEAGVADQWVFVGDFEGVRISWKYRKELKDQYESALKMENMNSYDVRVSYRPWFITVDGKEYTESGGSSVIRAGAAKVGSGSGLFFYARDYNGHPANPPVRGGVREFSIKRE